MAKVKLYIKTTRGRKITVHMDTEDGGWEKVKIGRRKQGSLYILRKFSYREPMITYLPVRGDNVMIHLLASQQDDTYGIYGTVV